MPNAIINKVSATCNIDMAELENRWASAEERVINQYGEKNKLNYALITGIFKRSLGKACNQKLGWTTNWSNKKPISESINELIFKMMK